MHIISWNINGLQALINKNGDKYIKNMNADIICLQEIKCQKSCIKLEGYYSYWNYGIKKGYSGTAIFTRIKPISIIIKFPFPKLAKITPILKKLPKSSIEEGRFICLEYEKFYLINTYFPNSGMELKRLQERLNWDIIFTKYIKTLEKPLIICGDFNVSQTILDIAEPKKHYNKHPGYTQKEIDSFKILLSNKLTDVYRYLHKDNKDYTFYTFLGKSLEKNTGYRCDLFLVSDSMKEKIKECKIDKISREKKYSDHCAIELCIDI
jgi:exodeoxyribonuclease-3